MNTSPQWYANASETILAHILIQNYYTFPSMLEILLWVKLLMFENQFEIFRWNGVLL